MRGRITNLVRKTETHNGGFGFIRDEQGHDRWFHARDLRGITFKQVQVNDTVEFEPRDNCSGGRNGRGNGLRAENVTVTE
jgi:cold shock CspA family protein